MVDEDEGEKGGASDSDKADLDNRYVQKSLALF
jgi:hypothetical protein